MSRDFNTGVIRVDASPITVAPVTQNVWFNARSLGGFPGLVHLGNSTGARRGWNIGINGTQLQYALYANEGSLFHNSGQNVLSTNTWHMVTVSTNGSNQDHATYTDGVPGNVSPSTRTINTVDRVALGRYDSASPSNTFNGLIAEYAIWNIVLTPLEIAGLYVGAGIARDAREVRPENLIFYVRLFASDGNVNYATSDEFDMTISDGTVTPGAEHPPISMWLPAMLTPSLVAPGPPTLSGTTTAVLNTEGDFDVSGQLAGSTTAVLETAGDFDVTTAQELAGATTAVLQTAGDMDVSAQLAGSTTALLQTAGNFTVTAPGQLAGSTTAVLQTAGEFDVSVVQQLAGSTTAVLETAGNMSTQVLLAGSTDALLNTSGNFPVGVLTPNPCRVTVLPDEGRSHKSTEC